MLCPKGNRGATAIPLPLSGLGETGSVQRIRFSDRGRAAAMCDALGKRRDEVRF